MKGMLDVIDRLRFSKPIYRTLDCEDNNQKVTVAMEMLLTQTSVGAVDCQHLTWHGRSLVQEMSCIDHCSILGISYNAPLLSSCATWHPDAITVINNSTGGSTPSGVYVTVNDEIYVTMGGRKQVQVWKEQNGIPTMTLAINMSLASYIFATISGDIYVANSGALNRVNKWTQNTTTRIPVMDANGICFGLFVDVIDNLYCAFEGPDQVVRVSPNETIDSFVVVAGTGVKGSGPNLP